MYNLAEEQEIADLLRVLIAGGTIIESEEELKGLSEEERAEILKKDTKKTKNYD